MAGVLPVLEDFIEQLEAEPIDDGPALTMAEKRRRRLDGRPPPLPYNWVEKSAGVFVKLGYSATYSWLLAAPLPLLLGECCSHWCAGNGTNARAPGSCRTHIRRAINNARQCDTT